MDFVLGLIKILLKVFFRLSYAYVVLITIIKSSYRTFSLAKLK